MFIEKNNTVTFITSGLCFCSSLSVEVSVQRYVWSVGLDISKGGKESAEKNFIFFFKSYIEQLCHSSTSSQVKSGSCTFFSGMATLWFFNLNL